MNNAEEFLVINFNLKTKNKVRFFLLLKEWINRKGETYFSTAEFRGFQTGLYYFRRFIFQIYEHMKTATKFKERILRIAGSILKKI